MTKDDKQDDKQPQSVVREVPEVQDTKVRTPGEEPGQVVTREAENPVGDAPVYPEPTGTDNGLPTTLQPSAAG